VQRDQQRRSARPHRQRVVLVAASARHGEGNQRRRVQAANAEARVRFLPFISVDDLIALYQRATALLYISLYEGFGIPILEAFTSGCPVIASNTTSIPEVAGNAALYVDPTNILAIEDAIARMCNDFLLHSDLKKKGYKRASQFGWDKVAQETLAVYYSLLSRTVGVLG
jgi:glycosyltransferase involved in cell wall biosynthesis